MHYKMVDVLMKYKLVASGVGFTKLASIVFQFDILGECKPF